MQRRAPTLLLLACTRMAAIPGPDPGEEPIVEGPLPAGWAATEPLPCEAPTTPQWVDIGSTLGFTAPIDHFVMEQTAVITGGGAHFFEIEGAGTIVDHHRDGTSRAVWAPWPVQRAGMVDLGQDGDDDLLLQGQGLFIRWDDETDHAREELLFPGEPFLVVRDAVPADLDGDGDEDLVAIIGGGEDGGISQGLWWAWEDGALQGPYPVWDPADRRWGNPFALRVMDFTGDGAPDLYLCNDFGPIQGGNWLLENVGGGGFAPLSSPSLELSIYCMGSSVGDVNRDGALDLYLGDIEDHHLLLAHEALYAEAQEALGLPAFAGHQMVWGSQIIDLDNDGYVDILAATSDFTIDAAIPFPLWAMMGQPDGTFVESSADLGLPQKAGTRALLAQDWTGDGLPELYVTDYDAPPRLFTSQGCTSQNWLDIYAPEGSVVTATVDGAVYTALVTGRPGFSAAMAPVAHLGLGPARAIDTLTLTLPWNSPQTLPGPLATRRSLRFTP